MNEPDSWIDRQPPQTQYALVRKRDGSPATFVHQDDSETPLVGGSLDCLIGPIGDWADMGVNAALNEMAKDDDGDDDNPLNQYMIVRETVTTSRLDDAEESVVAQKRGLPQPATETAQRESREEVDDFLPDGPSD